MEKKIRAAKGEGSFAYNPDGTVTHRKSVGRKTNGKRKILTVTAQTKTACIREMKKKVKNKYDIFNIGEVDSYEKERNIMDTGEGTVACGNKRYCYRIVS